MTRIGPLVYPAAILAGVAALALAWFGTAALIVAALHYPGIPVLAAVAVITARQAIHPHPLVTKLRAVVS